MAQLALPALIIGGITQATGSIMSGIEKSSAAAFEQQQYKIQQQQYQTAAAQDEAKRRQELTSAIDTITSIRAGRGVGQSSPTGVAILDDITRKGERDIDIAQSSYLTKADQARMAADMAERRSRMALVAGDLGAIGNIAGLGFKYAQYTKGIAA